MQFGDKLRRVIRILKDTTSKKMACSVDGTELLNVFRKE